MTSCDSRWLCGLIIVFACFSSHVHADERSADLDRFDKLVAPIIATRCLGCHNASDRKSGLDLSTRESAMAGGESGRVIVSHQPSASQLWDRISSDEMPPDDPLSGDAKEIIRNWIEQGAKWGTDPIDAFRFTSKTRAGRDWWAFQALKRPPVPASDFANPIDAFVHTRLQREDLDFSSPADPRSLTRRLSFDLLGLPPSADDIRAVRDAANENALADLAHKYLASRHYGEHWARHWLDVARYGESDGFEYDRMRPNAWPYRDWVINALNENMPYDEFARQQIAGDVLYPEDARAIIATGFLVCGAHDGLLPDVDLMRQIMRQDTLEDFVGTIGQTFLGMTVNCARCHDHKFDPITQREYYEMAAAVAGVRHGERPLPSEAGEKGEEKVYAAVAETSPGLSHLLMRGNPLQKSTIVTPGGLAAIQGLAADFELSPTATDRDRRVQLARWVSSANNPLFARVIVNRLWHYHFGRGLVATPNDLGFSGGRPSHPLLLDWLACELIEQNWSLKAIHFQIVTSRTFQQSSRSNAHAESIDAENRLLWRYAPRRLAAEEIRDAILAVSGQLNPTSGGPPFRDVRPYFRQGTQFYEPIDPEGTVFHRRSIYRMWARGGRNPLLDAFDCPDPSATAPARAMTTTPIQALMMLNSSFVMRLADQFAKDVQRESPQVDQQMTRVYQRALNRLPDDQEYDVARRFVEKHGLASFCRVLLNSNEFLHVE